MTSRLVVLVSGNGSNLQSIMDATRTGQLPDAIVSHVFCNKKDAYGLKRAQEANIPTTYHNLIPYGKRYPSPDPDVKYSQAAREAYDTDLADKVLNAKPTMVVCAGWMHILSNAFLEPLAKANVPILNLHPALPGEYDGSGAIERAYNDFERGITRRTGIMIHYVIREVDRGDPIITQEIEMKPHDTLEMLTQRIHLAEHELIVKGTKLALETLSQTSA